MARGRMIRWISVAQIISVFFYMPAFAEEFGPMLAEDTRLSYYEEAKLNYADEVAPVVVEVLEAKPKISANRPSLKKGSIFIQGSLSFSYKLIGFSYAQHALTLNSNAGAGYFIKDWWAVGANLPASINFLRGMMGTIGVSLFSTYFFDLQKIFYPYVGADLTPRFSPWQRAFLLSAGLNAGLLLSLNERVALDFCLGPELYFPLGDRQKWQLELPASFVGIRAFF